MQLMQTDEKKMEIKGLKNLGHSCFLNSIIQAIVGIDSVSNTLESLKSDQVLMNALRKVHASRRNECMRRLESVLQSSMDKGRRGTARSTSQKLSRLLELLPQIAIGAVPPLTPGRSIQDILSAINMSFTEQLMHLHAILNEPISSSSSTSSPMSLYLSFLSHSTLLPEAFEQSDVSEFLSFVLDTVHGELVSARYPEIPFNLITFDSQFSSECCDLFRGQYIGGNPFLELQLDIPIMQLVVGHYLPPHGWCLLPPSVSHCVRSIQIEHAPQVLVLNLNRAQFTSGKASKNTVHVTIDPYIVLSGHNYLLSSLVVHQGGGSHGGHYACFSKRRSDWYYLNDSDVRLIGSIDNVLSELEKNSKHYQPCLLFYEKLFAEFASPEFRLLQPARVS